MHFQLFERGFTLPEAIEEAKRCLTCGPCISCKACLSVGIQESLPAVEVNPDRCSGCGVCVSVCYYNAAQSKEIEDKTNFHDGHIQMQILRHVRGGMPLQCETDGGRYI